MEQNEYLKLAEVEDQMWYFRSLHRHVHRLLHRRLSRKRHPHLLDAGCGTAGLILRLKSWEPEWTFTGIDFSQLACELGKRRCPDAEIVHGSVTNLPFPDNTFDGITSADVMCQIDDPSLAVREFARCLKPGGVAVINVPAYRWMWSYHDDACQTKHRFVRREVRDLLSSAGLSSTDSTYWNCLPFPLLVLKRKLFTRKNSASDVRLYPAPLEAGFTGLMAVEHAWLRMAPRLPYGSSILAAGIKE